MKLSEVTPVSTAPDYTLIRKSVFGAMLKVGEKYAGTDWSKGYGSPSSENDPKVSMICSYAVKAGATDKSTDEAILKIVIDMVPGKAPVAATDAKAIADALALLPSPVLTP